MVTFIIDLHCMQQEMTLQVSVACTKAVVIRKTSEQSVDVPGVSYLYIYIYKAFRLSTFHSGHPAISQTTSYVKVVLALHEVLII